MSTLILSPRDNKFLYVFYVFNLLVASALIGLTVSQLSVPLLRLRSQTSSVPAWSSSPLLAVAIYGFLSPLSFVAAVIAVLPVCALLAPVVNMVLGGLGIGFGVWWMKWAQNSSSDLTAYQREIDSVRRFLMPSGGAFFFLAFLSVMYYFLSQRRRRNYIDTDIGVKAYAATHAIA